MPSLIDLLLSRLATLLPSELKPNELKQLLIPHRHSMLLTQRRATLIVNRVRLFAFLFAVLTPVWGIIDLMVFSYPLWLGLAAFRLLACGAFACLLLFYRPSGNLFDAYRAIAILFAIPTVFYIASHTLLGGYQLTQFSAVVATGYAFLPFVLMAGLAIFPLTLVENLVLAFILLLAQALAGYLSWSTLNWPSFAGCLLAADPHCRRYGPGKSEPVSVHDCAGAPGHSRPADTGFFRVAAARKSCSCSGIPRDVTTAAWLWLSLISITSSRSTIPSVTMPVIRCCVIAPDIF